MTEHTQPAHATDLLEFLRPVWRHRLFVAVVIALTTMATYAYNAGKPEQFRSSTQIFLQASEVDQSLYGLGGTSEGDRNIINQANLLQTPAVAQEVAKRVGFEGDPGVLLGAISVTPSTGSDFLRVTAVGGSAAAAAELANAFAAAFIRLRADTVRRDVERALATARRQLQRVPVNDRTIATRDTLRTRISSLEAIQSLSPGGARQIDRAVPAAAPFAPQPRRTALFGFMLSLVFAVLGAYGLERLDRRVKHLDEVAPAYDAPVLAALPPIRSTTSAGSNGHAPQIVPDLREAVRGLRTNLQLASPDKPFRTFLVTSALPGEGKSLLVLNLALAYAETGLRVAVIECDLRLSSLARLMAIRSSPGLTDVLAGNCNLAAAVQQVKVGAPTVPQVAIAAASGGSGAWARGSAILTVLTAGDPPADPSSLLATQSMTRILEAAREQADIVIIDTPPLLSVADALPLLGWVDATIVVARIGTTTRPAARRLREIIARIPDVSLLGVVANDVPDTERAYYGQLGIDGRSPDDGR